MHSTPSQRYRTRGTHTWKTNIVHSSSGYSQMVILAPECIRPGKYPLLVIGGGRALIYHC
ncbi:hypothetical protein M405DRAFT_833824 [Rhizopogon salebrosus TDB-379]|nr:hypothetical protein M405DRAFT_833824 [Rhizopogon salebrosus TDB-379]